MSPMSRVRAMRATRPNLQKKPTALFEEGMFAADPAAKGGSDSDSGDDDLQKF
jgi:hypothetical protein